MIILFFNDILLNWHFNAFSCIFLYTYVLTIVTPYSSLPPLWNLNMPPPHFHVSFFSVPVIPIRDAQMCIGVGHPPAHGQPTSGHTLEEDPAYPYQSSTAKSTLPREGIHEPLSSPCWVADWHDLGHILSESPLLFYMSLWGQQPSHVQKTAFCNTLW